MKLEACIETPDEASLAALFNLDRAELCQALDLGGLTPSSGLTSICSKYIEVHAMVRVRPGNFHYSEVELEVMAAEMEMLKNAGATGVVFGCLNKNMGLDIPANSFLVTRALDLALIPTFHRAFDNIPDKPKALEDLIHLGFQRILTSGGNGTAIEGIDVITGIKILAKNRIEIMAGGGVNANNAYHLARTGVDGLHFSIRKLNGEKAAKGMGNQYIPDSEKIEAILKALGT
jgi:copper homeostasis protein